MIKKILLSACILASSISSVMANDVSDPLESVNRPISKFNQTFDRYLLKPIAKGYDTVAPEFVQDGVGNFFSNLKYPIVITNQFLQGKVKLGFQDTTRFLINSTFGVLGLFDVADKFGLEEHEEDFGQTLAVWGVGSGPYIVLPLLGPSNARDLVGRVGDYYVDPMNRDYFDDRRATKNRLMALNVIDTRAQLLKVEKLIVGDRYVFMRDAYSQKRNDLILDGEYNEEADPFLDD